MGSHTGSLEGLRQRNRLRVIEVLRTRGSVSRAEIARRTGLSRTTVSSLVGQLQDSGLVVERTADTAPRGPEGGRPPVLLALDRTAGVLVGIDFGHRHLRVVVSDLAYTPIAETRADLEVDHAGLEGLDLAAGLVRRLLADHDVPHDRVVGAGMGLPAPIERDTGLVGSQAILPSLVGVDAASEMGDRLGLVVHLDNDANVGALGEAVFGAGRDHEVMAYLRLSSGIGCGLVLQGEPFRGSSGYAGEIGHVLVDPNGPICRCGNRGCLETFASTGALTELLRRSHGEVGVGELLDQAAAGDVGCRRVIQDAGRVVGRATADLCNYLNPDVVVVGGDLSAAGELLLGPLREAVRRFAIPAAAAGVQIVAGELGDRAELLGALALAAHEADDLVASHVTPMSQATRRRSR